MFQSKISEMNEVILVIYTGGTIGMIPDKNGALIPSKGALSKCIRHQSQMHDEHYYREFCQKEEDLLILPDINNNKDKIFYVINEWEDPLDSSNISIAEWVKMAKQIKDNYDKYAAFVVLHGTDTMAYTAAALSMMLEGLNKTVIITGAQIPIFNARSDACNNFKSALMIAGTKVIPEVSLFFNNRLLRGNRSTKVSNCNFSAFDSPNYEPLLESGINLHINHRAVLKSPPHVNLQYHPFENRIITIIYFYPGITSDIIGKLLESPTEGAVLLTYGSGNIPSSSTEIQNELRKAAKRGVMMVNVSQCLHGSVQPIYEAGKFLTECNAIPGYDMTVEACFAKLIYVLSRNDWNMETKRFMMNTNLRGELTSHDN